MECYANKKNEIGVSLKIEEFPVYVKYKSWEQYTSP